MSRNTSRRGRERTVWGHLWPARRKAGLALRARLEGLEDRTLMTVTLVKDINRTDLFPAEITTAGGSAYFVTPDPSPNGGADLWATDGTAAGTVLVKAYPAPFSSGAAPDSGTLVIRDLTNVNGTLYFVAPRAGFNFGEQELDKVDPVTKAVSTVQVLGGLGVGRDPTDFLAVGNTLYFVTTGVSQAYLLKTDGTPSGTTAVTTFPLPSGAGASTPNSLVALGGKIFFSGFDATAGQEVWVSDGTPSGTQVFADLNPGPTGSNPASLTVAGDKLFFYATVNNVASLYASDGTPGGTKALVAQALPTGIASPLAALGNKVFFAAQAGISPYRVASLWSSDGTAAGTYEVKPLTNVADITAAGAKLFLTADDGAGGRELLAGDGTAAGTSVVATVSVLGQTAIYNYSSVSGAFYSFGPAPAPVLTASGSAVYFAGFDPTRGRELWRSDGTAGGTGPVADLNPGPDGSDPSGLSAFGSEVLFAAHNGTHANQLWINDGTAAGSQPLAAFAQGATAGSIAALASPYDQSPAATGRSFVSGNLLYVVADDGEHGPELWRTDGTTSGTFLLTDIHPGPDGSAPADFAAVGNTVFFTADDGTHGRELWKTDGTTAGTSMVVDLNPGAARGVIPSYDQFANSPHGLVAVGGKVYFIGDDGSGKHGLFASDGTPGGTALVAASSSSLDETADLTVAASAIYFTDFIFSQGIQIFKYDLATGTSTQITKISTAPGRPANLVSVGSQLFFTAPHGTSGQALWVTDGTPGGEVVLTDLGAGTSVSDLTEKAVVGSRLFLAAGTPGQPLLVSDGTVAGTRYIFGGDGQPLASVGSLTSFGGALYFTNLLSGSLMRSDGTVAGTTRVVTSAGYGPLRAIGGSLYYVAYDPSQVGYVLFKSDGTAAGTASFTFLGNTYAASFTAPQMALPNGHLLASGDDGLHGGELLDLGFSGINHAPTIAAVPTQSGAPGQMLSVNIVAADPDAGQVLAYSLDPGGPDGAAIDAITGKLTFTAPVTPVPGSYTITVRVTDNGFPALSATTTVSVLVEAAATEISTLVKDVNTFPQTVTGKPITVGSGAFFLVTDPAGAITLWHTDGSMAGTATIRTFPLNLGPENLTSVGGMLFFAADNPDSSTTLWKSDGSVAGTVAVQTFPSRLGHALSSLTALGSTLFFTVTKPSAASTSLWRSDGTAAGTVLASDFSTGTGGGNPYGLTAVGSTLFFATSGGTLANGLGIWSIGQTGVASQITSLSAPSGQFLSLGNGFAAGSRWVFSVNGNHSGSSAADLYASDGTSGSTGVIEAGLTPDGNFATLGGTLVFGATETGGAGDEAWSTDGTSGGTTLLKDVNPGPSGLSPADFVTSGGKVYFTAGDNTGTRSIYTTDGTPGGTKVVAAILTSSSGSGLAAVGGGVVFSAFDASDGRELWSSDGTAAHTGLLKDLNPGPVGSAPDSFTAFPGGVLFTATSATGQTQLFVTDGTSGGTKALASFSSASNNGSVLSYAIGRPGTTAVLNNVLYYAATDGDHGTELFRSDGTAAGTSLITDIVPGPDGSNPTNLLAANGSVFFVTTPDNGAFGGRSGDVKIYKTDGTAGGTVALQNLGPNGSVSPAFVTLGPNLYILASLDGLTSSLYRTDGSVSGTVAIASLPIDAAELVAANGKLFFANSDVAHGTELWTSDGTTGGTALLADVNSGVGGSNPSNFTAAGARVYFSANDGTTGSQLWTSDGTPGGTARLTSLGALATNQGPTEIAPFATLVAFTTSDGGTSAALYVSDGTPANTKPLTDALSNPLSGASDLKVTGGRLFFTIGTGANAGLWTSDGTAANTVRIVTVVPTNTYVVGSVLDFTLGDSGGSLYQTNGTLAGTVHLLAGPNAVAPLMALPGGAILVAADDGTHGSELAIASVPGSGNHAPTLDNILAQTVTQGNLLSFQAVGHDQDAGQIVSYSLDPGFPTGAAIVAATGVFSYTPTTALAPGDYFVTVRVTDNAAMPLSASQQVKIAVNAINHKPIIGAIGDEMVDEGSTLTLDLTKFASDPDAGQTLTYSLESAAPGGLSLDTKTGILTYLPASGPSLATVTFHVTDNGSPTLSSDPRTFHITVNDVAPVVALPAAGSVVTGVTLAANGSFTDPGKQTWTATVDYGDSSGTQLLAVNQAAKSFALSHAYVAPGTYSAKVTVDDGAGKTGTATEVVTVSTPIVPHPGSVGLSASPAQVSERGGVIQFTVTRTGGSDGTVTVNYATTDGSALAGSAYVATSGTLSFAPGEISKTVTVPILDQGLFSGDKVFGFTLSSAGGGATLSATNSAVATIHDDDPAPPLVTVLPVGSVTSSKKLGITGFVIKVSGKLDAGSAQNLGNYQLFQVVKKGKKTTHKSIPLMSATYNDANGTITLAPLKKKFSLKGSAVLQITGDGIRDLLGRALDANHDGQPGGTGTATVTSNTVRVASIVAVVHAKAVDHVLGSWRSRPKG